MESLGPDLLKLVQIIWINIILSGDNAVVIGLAAAGLPEAQRNRAALFGITAALLRIAFSVFASFLLARGGWISRAAPRCCGSPLPSCKSSSPERAR